jgi:putative hydrolase of the HAD superfamily
MMQKPKMILFDYGQTLINEQGFDGERGTAAVMQYAVANKYNRSPQEVQAEANAINKELNRFSPETRHLFQVEVAVEPFNAYMYESLGIQLSISYEEAGEIFWDNATTYQPTDGIADFLSYLHNRGIRSGVISNISFSGKALADRINRLLPEHHFEMIIASSEYVFRKPNRRIFELALTKADLKAEDVWYVGDQYECDVVGAKGAGMFPIWYTGAIDFKQEMDRDCLKIATWEELKKKIEQL